MKRSPRGTLLFGKQASDQRPGLPGGAPYRRRVLEAADRQEAMLDGLARVRAFTVDRYVADKWAHIGGLPQRIPDHDALKAQIRSERAAALGLIDPTKGPNR